MKVKMAQKISGLRNNEPWPEVGGEIVVPDSEGASLCANGYATPVAEAPKPEKRAPKRKG